MVVSEPVKEPAFLLATKEDLNLINLSINNVKNLRFEGAFVVN